jgi:hypothetical protein
MSGTLNPLAAQQPGGTPAGPTPNALSTGSIPAAPASPNQGPPPVGAVMQHFAQMDLPPQAIAQGITRANYLTAELARLAGNPTVNRKDVVKATADAVGAHRIEAAEGIQFISQMPEKPEQLRPWLQQQYQSALVGAVALHAHAHQVVNGAAQGPPGGAPAPGAAMPGPAAQGPVAAPVGGAAGMPGGMR